MKKTTKMRRLAFKMPNMKSTSSCSSGSNYSVLGNLQKARKVEMRKRSVRCCHLHHP
jgi:hypothetical protein